MASFTPSFRESELRRFNELTPDAAQDILQKFDGQQSAIRSCWYCNGAHSHLQQAAYPFICVVGCGNWYIGGFPAAIVAMRSKGDLITSDIMDQFESTIDA